MGKESLINKVVNFEPINSKRAVARPHNKVLSKAGVIKTIDKLCRINKELKKFIEQIEKLITANEKYVKSTEKELEEFCDSYLSNNTDVEKYCLKKRIPVEKTFSN